MISKNENILLIKQIVVTILVVNLCCHAFTLQQVLTGSRLTQAKSYQDGIRGSKPKQKLVSSSAKSFFFTQLASSWQALLSKLKLQISDCDQNTDGIRKLEILVESVIFSFKTAKKEQLSKEG